MNAEIFDFNLIKLLKILGGKLLEFRDKKSKELSAIGEMFGNPLELANFYIEPEFQNVNPADHDEDGPISVAKMPIIDGINSFFNKEFAHRGDGCSQLFVLADAGMGKTSLLVMIKLFHLTSFWPKRYNCVLLKILPETLEIIQGLEERSNTILLLDALDEDPCAWNDHRKRVLSILSLTKNFKRVIISCRTQFFPNDELEETKRPDRIQVGGFNCPLIFLSLFSDLHVKLYLEKRYAKKTQVSSKGDKYN